MVLAIAPCFDEVTRYSLKWIKRLLKDLGIDAERLFGDDATRENFERCVGNHDLVIFYDHGDEKGLFAQGGVTRVVDKRNAHLLKGKVIYTLACLWCSDGGIDAWRKGARVVWGYVKEFVFTSEEERLFMECANYGLIVKYKENITWEEAYKRTIDKFNEVIKRAKSGWSKVWLRYDRDALVCYTENNPPETSKCFLRRLLIRLLGARRAWKIQVTHSLGLMLTFIGYGIALHDYAHQVWELRGTVLSLEGGYIGFIVLIVGLLLLLVPIRLDM